ncbi:hypothetical protein UFOVP978_30 [uncultured Caudovirales phage]|uniref:Uncharacterized protein n=1 Tax=uncultured Caudovirales phage TaxID=2100421 RepID=A0A6J5PWY7_9CAUD|nr:hypothetical protein UFOVP978_30 [uncultured Caudovirales phage]
MAFVHGKNARVLLNGADASYWLRSVQWNQQSDVAETTAFGTTAKTYLSGMSGFTMGMGGMFEDTATTGFDAVVSPLLGSGTLNNVAMAPNGFTIGRPAWAVSGAITSYDVQGGVGDIVQASVNVQGSDRVSRGVSLRDNTATSVAATTSEASVNNAAATTTGYVAYLFVTGVPTSGTTPSVTVTVEHSTNNSSWSSLTSFAAVTTTVGSERKTATGTVNQYLRATATVTGSAIVGGWSYSVVFIRLPF